MIDRDRLEVDHQRVGHPLDPREHLAPGLDRKIDVVDGLAELLRHHARHLRQRQVARSRDDISLTHVVRRVGEDARHDAGNVGRRDGRVLLGAIGR